MLIILVIGYLESLFFYHNLRVVKFTCIIILEQKLDKYTYKSNIPEKKYYHGIPRISEIDLDLKKKNKNR